MSNNNMMPVEEFAQQTGKEVDKVIEMIRDGVFAGKLIDGKWYIEKSHLSKTQGVNTATAEKKFNEYVVSDFIDSLLDKLRKGYLLNFFEDNQKWLTKYGLYGLYLSVALGFISAIALPNMYKIKDEVAFGIFVGFFFFCFIAHYLAVKFLPNVDSMLANTPSKLRSKAFLDSFALIFSILGISALGIGIFFGILEENFNTFMYGVFGFILCEYLVSLCLKPELLNVSVENGINAAEELLGLTSFFIKASLKLVPIIFGSSVIFGIFSLSGMLFVKYEYMGEISADFLFVCFIYAGALSPIIGYLAFLSYYFIIDIILAILFNSDYYQ